MSNRFGSDRELRRSIGFIDLRHAFLLPASRAPVPSFGDERIAAINTWLYSQRDSWKKRTAGRSGLQSRLSLRSLRTAPSIQASLAPALRWRRESQDLRIAAADMTQAPASSSPRRPP